jgi:acetylornithine deacetylase
MTDMNEGVLRSATELTDRLIGFPTVSVDSNLDLIDFAAELLTQLGATVQLTHDPGGNKANLFATIGPNVDGGVVLSGHTDVVPVAGQDWTTDPFTSTHRDGRIYGRGSCDMKGFLACALAMGPQFAQADLKRPVHFALTYDEEVGCVGAPLLLEALSKSGPKPAIAIIGEPTSMKIIEGHKGCYEYTTRVRGLEGHGSLPDAGVSAVEAAVQIISEMMQVGDEFRGRAPASSPFTPPWTTVSIGKIEGGIARNIIAKDCAFEWEMRPVQRSDSDLLWKRVDALVNNSLLPAMRERFDGASVVTETAGEVDGLEPMEGSEAIALVHELTGGNARDVVSFGTEAGLFQNAGISTALCGPGSIDQAHRPDEYVDVSQLGECLGMLSRLTNKLEREL